MSKERKVPNDIERDWADSKSMSETIHSHAYRFGRTWAGGSITRIGKIQFERFNSSSVHIYIVPEGLLNQRGEGFSTGDPDTWCAIYRYHGFLVDGPHIDGPVKAAYDQLVREVEFAQSEEAQLEVMRIARERAALQKEINELLGLE